MFVSYAPEFSVSSCGHTLEEAKKNLKEAVEGFLETAHDMGTLPDILEEAGYTYKNKHWTDPELLVMDRLSLSY
jgi:predicted RNase H-like HicB family nuclease